MIVIVPTYDDSRAKIALWNGHPGEYFTELTTIDNKNTQTNIEHNVFYFMHITLNFTYSMVTYWQLKMFNTEK